jgi:hypothetical protein
MIPEGKQSAVARVLDEAFGVREFDEIRPLTGGLTTVLVFRIVIRSHSYLLLTWGFSSLAPCIEFTP